MASKKKVFITDCEGPVSKNDNAFELTSHYIPQGDIFFRKLSRYDDVLADIIKKPGYKAGNTLCLILPFLKAYGVSNDVMRSFSRKTLTLMKDSIESLNFLKNLLPSYIVSTSYEHYIKALCEAIGFPVENTYSTKVDIDKYELSEQERHQLLNIVNVVLTLPDIEIPNTALSIEDLPQPSRFAVNKLNEIFWSHIAKMSCSTMLSEVKVVGGEEKANAIKEIVAKEGCEISDVIYFGDSITDVEAFKLVRENGGLAVSFNGNEYAIREAQLAILSETAASIPLITLLFMKYGREKLCKLLSKGEDITTLIDEAITLGLTGKLAKALKSSYVKIELITQDNKEKLALESSSFRKKVRGVAIGGLG